MRHDVMHRFELFQPADVGGVVDLLEAHGGEAWIIAGGQDSLDWFKDRVKTPKVLIDVSGVDSLKGIREIDDGIEIGACTTLSTILADPIITKHYGLLSRAASHVASPQIRNQGTLGGNVCQDTRCWYYRSGLDCYRAGGSTCYANTPEGMDREHCIFGASMCVAVSPSDTAAALVALEASMLVRSGTGQRIVPADEFFVGPHIDITRMTVLESGDLLTAIRIPSEWADSRFYFEKVADRNTWDFALVSVAAALKVKPDGTIADARMVCGGVECVPRRLKIVEETVRGSAKDEETAHIASRIATQGAVTLNHNQFKVPLMESLVLRAIRDS